MASSDNLVTVDSSSDDEIEIVKQLVRCVNLNCPRKTREFRAASEQCRGFYVGPRKPSDAVGNGAAESARLISYVCTWCHGQYKKAMTKLADSVLHEEIFDLTDLPVFGINFQSRAVTIDDEDGKETVKDPVVMDVALSDDDEAMDHDDIIEFPPGVNPREFVEEKVAAIVDPVLSGFVEREKSKQTMLNGVLVELRSAVEEMEEAASSIQTEKGALDSEFPRRTLIHCPEVDGDAVPGLPARPISAGAEGGAASSPPLWATKENIERAKGAGFAHVVRPGVVSFAMNGSMGVPRRFAPQTISPEKPEVIAIGVKNLAAKDLPPPGQQPYEELLVGMSVFADSRNMRDPAWYHGLIFGPPDADEKFHVKCVKPGVSPAELMKDDVGEIIVVPKRQIAYAEAPKFRIEFGTRVIAAREPGCDKYYPGTVTEPPSPVNRYRYLVFFDTDRFEYCSHKDTRLICDVPKHGAWERCPKHLSHILKRYIEEWPERPMLKLVPGNQHEVYDNGAFRKAVVVEVDASLARFKFEKRDEDVTTTEFEWIYRGSSRLKLIYDNVARQEKQKRGRGPIPVRSSGGIKEGGAVIQYTNADSEVAAAHEAMQRAKVQRAKKSTGATSKPSAAPAHPVSEKQGRTRRLKVNRVIRRRRYRPHRCSMMCWGGHDPSIIADVTQIKNVEKPSPFLLPLKLGFTRHVLMETPANGVRNGRYVEYAQKNKQRTYVVFYTAPCGRTLQNIAEVHGYLLNAKLPLSIDQFLFTPRLSATVEFISSAGKFFCHDLTKGLEAVPISCVNLFDRELPKVVANNDYASMRVYDKEKVKINTDVDFLVCCDCEDDCSNPANCACQQLTVSQARDIRKPNKTPKNVLYKYRRLEERVDTGIFECNRGCKCKKEMCFNRVAQNPISVKLELFKTEKKKWGVRSLQDLPSGCFVATYAGQILTADDAQEDGNTFGDDYLAELDFIQINEREKEGYEPEVETSTEEESSDEEMEEASSNAGRRSDDEDFVLPGVSIPPRTENAEDGSPVERPRRRTRRNIPEPVPAAVPPAARGKKTAKPDVEYTPLLSHLSEKNPYVMDAKTGGNIGKYFNHSCEPNMFVQNVFVDTHDPRFHWLALFTARDIHAGEELCWDYGYEVGSIAGRKITCYCGSSTCRGRLL